MVILLAGCTSFVSLPVDEPKIPMDSLRTLPPMVSRDATLPPVLLDTEPKTWEATLTPLPIEEMLRKLPVVISALLFYDPTNGEVVFYKTDGAGNLELINQYGDWPVNLTILAGEFMGDMRTDLLVYNKQNGEVWFHEMEEDGVIGEKSINHATRISWDLMAVGEFGDLGDVRAER